MYRCGEMTVLRRDLLDAAKQLPFPDNDDVDWVSGDPAVCALQCLVEDVPHDHHAAFVRSGSAQEPWTEVFLCWRNTTGEHWLAELAICPGEHETRDESCTSFLDHPGRCTWQYIDPPLVAARARVDRIDQQYGISQAFRERV